MPNPEFDKHAGGQIDRIMLHDLANHLTIALGHSDLLLLELEADAPLRPAIAEIHDACRRAVDLVEGWRAHLPHGE